MTPRQELDALEAEEAWLTVTVREQINRIQSGAANLHEIAAYERNATRLLVLEREIAHTKFTVIWGGRKSA